MGVREELNEREFEGECIQETWTIGVSVDIVGKESGEENEREVRIGEMDTTDIAILEGKAADPKQEVDLDQNNTQ